jgi:hypothetical protein
MVLLVLLAAISAGGVLAVKAQQPAGALTPAAANAALGTAFTYQGELKQNGSLYSGTCDFRFGLWDAASGGNPVPNNPFFPKPNPLNVPVQAGKFTVSLDFGNVYNGTALWLETEVRCPASGGSYTLLSPRTELTAAPYAQGLKPGAMIAPQAGGPVVVFSAINSTTASGSPQPVGIFGQAVEYDSSYTPPNAPAGVVGVADTGYGVHGTGGFTGVKGTGGLFGVYGTSDNLFGRGVIGEATIPSGYGVGVYGESASDEGIGMVGYAANSTGQNIGVYGESVSEQGTGVYGYASAGIGSPKGVEGQSDSPSGTGVYGWASAQNGLTQGVLGMSVSTAGTGIFGLAESNNGPTRGVYGVSKSIDGSGVVGWAQSSTGVTFGVRGDSGSNSGFGVFGNTYGVSGNTYGVAGQSNSTSGVGTSGYASATSGVTVGVRGQSDSPSGYGVYGYNANTNGWAAWFDGKVRVNGTLTKSAGSFQIDHPLDPANQYLYHSFVESPDMKNIYDGVVVLDAYGEAIVSMPDWFQALNGGDAYQTDYRYQLTPIGAAMPDLYIAQKIEGNTFKIAGGAPGMEVSWQVTGIRHDPYAEANRIPVEQAKPASEQGTYLFPGLYGQSPELGSSYPIQALPVQSPANYPEIKTPNPASIQP